MTEQIEKAMEQERAGWKYQGIWYLGYLGLSIAVGLPSAFVVPRLIEQYRFRAEDTALLLPADMLVTKHLAFICSGIPVVFLLLFVLSFAFKQVLSNKIILGCAIGLAVLYGAYAVFLSLSFQTSTQISKVLLSEARERGKVYSDD